jgi:hypothetical protein
MQQVVPRGRGDRPPRFTTATGYAMLLVIAIVAFAFVTKEIPGGWLRAVVYGTLLGFVWALVSWIVAGRSATRSIVLSGDGIEWFDQRMRKGSMSREAVSRVEQHRYRTSLGTRSSSWVVDTTGRASVKLMPRFPAEELATALNVPLLVAPGVAHDQRDLERLLPGSGELAVQKPLLRYVIPFGLGIVAVALNTNQLT